MVLGDYDRTQTDGGEQFIDIAAAEIVSIFHLMAISNQFKYYICLETLKLFSIQTLKGIS